MKLFKLLIYAILILTSMIPVNAKEYGSFKAYMDYQSITDRTTIQWELQQSAQTDSHGIRTLDDRYMIAIGTGWQFKVGNLIVVKLDSGVTLPCIVGDVKQDIHTDISNRYTKVGDKTNVVEFIVDIDDLSSKAKEMGDISYSELVFKGNVLGIEKAHTTTNCVSKTKNINSDIVSQKRGKVKMYICNRCEDLVEEIPNYQEIRPYSNSSAYETTYDWECAGVEGI